MAKRGPRTVAGKRAVGQNARKHGIFSDVGVIPGLEDPNEWDAHVQGLSKSFDPQDYIETLLVEKIAWYLWRQRRAARYERDALALSLEGLSVEHGSTVLDDVLLSDHRALQVKRLLPEASVLERVTRYESHLQRQLQQTMHELEALQRRRRGEAAPLARLDVTLSPTDEST